MITASTDGKPKNSFTHKNAPARGFFFCLNTGMKSPYTFFAEARYARDSLSALGAADAADLKEYPGKRGKRAHRKLHREIGKLLKGRLSKTGAELAVGMNEAQTRKH